TLDHSSKGKASPAAIRAVYSVILAELEKDGVEKLVLPGLGRFTVKKVEKDGVVNKRILFKAGKPKQAKK
ncbi:hypothetical protein, partial [Leucothrix pacifica]